MERLRLRKVFEIGLRCFIHTKTIQCPIKIGPHSLELEVLPTHLGNDSLRIMNDGETIFSLNANKYVMPASNMKIVTLAAAAERLGWDYIITTDVIANGSIDASGTLHGDLVIVGHVQGVGFRYAMVMKAAEIGITGWVRNRSDGAVEAIVQGSPEAVARMLAWTRHGPRSARVDRVEVEPGEGEYTTFEARGSE